MRNENEKYFRFHPKQLGNIEREEYHEKKTESNQVIMIVKYHLQSMILGSTIKRKRNTIRSKKK